MIRHWGVSRQYLNAGAMPGEWRREKVRVGLFNLCYMDAFEPHVGIATLELLEKLDCAVSTRAIKPVADSP